MKTIQGKLWHMKIYVHDIHKKNTCRTNWYPKSSRKLLLNPPPLLSKLNFFLFWKKDIEKIVLPVWQTNVFFVSAKNHYLWPKKHNIFLLLWQKWEKYFFCKVAFPSPLAPSDGTRACARVWKLFHKLISPFFKYIQNKIYIRIYFPQTDFPFLKYIWIFFSQKLIFIFLDMFMYWYIRIFFPQTGFPFLNILMYWYIRIYITQTVFI